MKAKQLITAAALLLLLIPFVSCTEGGEDTIIKKTNITTNVTTGLAYDTRSTVYLAWSNTGDDEDVFTTNATVTVTAAEDTEIELSLETNNSDGDLEDHDAPMNAMTTFDMPSEGMTNVDLVALFGLTAPTGTNTLPLKLTTSATDGSKESTTAAIEFTLVAALTTTVTLALETDDGDGMSDLVTTDSSVEVGGTIPEGAMLAFAVTTNEEAHTPTTALDTTTAGLSQTNDLGLASATESMEVSVVATLSRNGEEAVSNFTYILLPSAWTTATTGPTTTVTVTSNTNLTFAGLEVFDPAMIKVKSYIVSNTNDDMTNDVDVDEMERVALSEDYELDIAEVHPFLDSDEVIHSLTLDFVGNEIEHTDFDSETTGDQALTETTGDQALSYMILAIFDREFDVPEAPFGIAINSNGILFVTVNLTHKIHFYNIDGTDATIMINGTAQSNFGGMSVGADSLPSGMSPANLKFNSPYDVTFDDDGKIYVADHVNHRIQVLNDNFTHNTNIVGVGADSPPDDLWDLRAPTPEYNPTRRPLLVHHYDGYIFVISTFRHPYYNRLRRFKVADLSMEADAINSKFYGMAVDSGTNIHFLDWDRDRIHTYTGSADSLSSARFSASLAPNDHVDSSKPWDIVVDARDRLYISDLAQHRILIYEYSTNSPHYTSLGFIGNPSDRLPGDGEGEFNEPFRMLVHDGELFVVDQKNSRIQVFKVPE